MDRSATYDFLLWLPEADRASAFVVDRAKSFLTSSSITVQNLVAVTHTVERAYSRSLLFFGGGRAGVDAGAPPLRRGRG